MRVYSHSNILYWWAIWASSLICGAISFSAGEMVRIGDHLAVIHPSEWLHLSFVFVTVVVLLFTQIRLRGVQGYVATAALGYLLYAVIAESALSEWFERYPGSFPALSGSFYIAFGLTILAVWLVSFLIVDRMTYVEFEANQVTEVNFLTGQQDAYSTMLSAIRCERTDPLMNFILGLGWLGLGTADIVIQVQDQKNNAHRVRVENVWRGRALVRRLQRNFGVAPADDAKA